MHKWLAALSLVAIPLFAANHEDFRPATPEELALKSTPLAPGASAVVLDWNQREDDSGRWESQYVRIKVLKEDGRKYANVEVPFIGWKYDLAEVTARVIRPDGTIVPYTGKVFDKVLYRHGGLKVRAKTFTLPDVQIGSILEYSYTRRWQDATRTWFGIRWTVQSELPVLHEYLWIRPDRGRDVHSAFLSYVGLPEGKQPVKSGGSYELELENLPPFPREPFGPPDEEVSARIHLMYTDSAEAEVFWKHVAEVFGHDVEDYVGRGASSEAAAIIGGAADADTKLRKLYAHVQHFKNLSYSDDDGVHTYKDNKSAADVLRNKYGERNQINRAFVALARGVGLDAHIVCISDREDRYFNRSLPDWTQILFEEIAVVTVDGKSRYFDPGIPFIPYGMLSWQNSGVPGLRIDSKNGGTWIDTPPQTLADASMSRTADLRFDGDVLKGKVVATYAGLEALHRRLKSYSDDETVARKALEDDAKTWFPDGSSVKLVKVTELKGSDEPLVAEYDVELQTLGVHTGRRLLLPMSVFQATEKNPFVSEDRKLPICYRYQSSSNDAVTFHLPENYAVEAVPKGWTLNFGAVKFESEYKQREGIIELTRNMAVKATMIEREHYGTLRDFYTKIAGADHDSVVLLKMEGAE
jgi:hypothetical protein